MHCECGCGQITNVAKRSITMYGHVRGEHIRFIGGHQNRGRFEDRGPGPNASGLCMCGCGEETSIARRNDASNGLHYGQPLRFIRGHHLRYDWRSQLVRGDGCWIWGGSVDKDGYGKLKIDGSMWLAHRMVYEDLVGPIPAAHVLHHACETPPCVNPEHLVPMTRHAHSHLHKTS